MLKLFPTSDCSINEFREFLKEVLKMARNARLIIFTIFTFVFSHIIISNNLVIRVQYIIFTSKNLFF